MKPFNRSTSAMPSSGIRKIMALSEDVPGCIHLEVGQPDFRTPEHILEALAAAAREGRTKYTNSAGIRELREAIAEKVRRQNGFDADFRNVVVSPGAVCSMFTTLLTIAEAGDEILLPDPGWPNYTMQTPCIGLDPVYYTLDPARGFLIDFDALEQLVGPKTKALVITNPGNPTGAVFPAEDVERAVAFARRHDLYLVSDEIYEDIVFDGAHTSAGQFDDEGRVVSVFGFSKTYAATGLRVGYTVCSEDIAAVLTKVQEPVVSCASSVSQYGCLAALTGPREPVTAMVDAYRARRDAVVDILREHDLLLYTSRGAFYTLIDISRTGMNSTDFAVELLREKKVAVAPGETFGASTSSFVRISFAIDIDRLRQGVRILCERINA